MAIPGQANINIANTPNDPIGSDSLFTAFNTVQDNFTKLFTQSSNLSTVVAGPGINIETPTANSYKITNSGVTSIIAGNNITISSVSGTPGTTGSLIINATGGNGGGGGVTSVGVASNSLSVTNSPIIASGNISIELPNTGVAAGTYRNPNVAVDSKGRITSIANGAFTGVTSVGVIGGAGISVSGSPVNGNSGGNTGAGNITLENTGVLSLTAGTGIVLSNTTGNITISSTGGGGGGAGTVTSVGIASNTLTVAGSPIVSSGTITLELPSSPSFNIVTANTGNIRNVSSNSLTLTLDANTNANVVFTTYGNSATANIISVRRSRGNVSSPLPAETGDQLLSIQAEGWTNFNKFQVAGSLDFISLGAPANSSSPVPSRARITTYGSPDTVHQFRFNANGSMGVPGTLYNSTYSNTVAPITQFSTRARGTNTSLINLAVGDFVQQTIHYGYTGNGLFTFEGTPGYSYAGSTDVRVVALPAASGAYVPSEYNIRTVSVANVVNVFRFTQSGNFNITGAFNGNGAGLTNIPGGNVSGAVTFATTANSVAGANVSGQVSNALVSGTVYVAAQPNITSVGTLTSLSVSGTITGNAAGLTYIPAANLNGSVNNNIVVSASANSNNTVGNLVSITINGTTYQLLAK